MFVGVDNYTAIVTDPGVRENFIPILLWSFAFAIGTVVLQFVFGLLLAIVMQEKKMRGKGVYRLLLILPYALPIFMTALVWKGMLNTDFGLINQIIGQPIPWLNDAWLAKIALLVVNLWIGYSWFPGGHRCADLSAWYRKKHSWTGRVVGGLSAQWYCRC